MISSFVFLHLVITVYILSFIFPFSNGTTTNSKSYKVCKNHLYSCGSFIQNLGYPFWSDDKNRPDYCGGGEEFKITCWDKRKQSHIGLSSTPIYMLEVGGINTSSQTIKLSTDMNKTCESLDKEKVSNIMPPFMLGRGVQHLNLFGGCNSSNPEYKHLKSFNCTSSFGYNNTLNYINKPGQVMPRFCKSNFSIPVPEQLLQEFYQANGTVEFDSLLKEGFELTYKQRNLSACLACQKSGGICGSSGEPNWEFLCYHGRRIATGLKIGIGILGSAMLSVVLIALWYCKKRKLFPSFCVTRNESLEPSNLEKGGIYFGIPLFSYTELEKATKNFDLSNELGDGGFGIVYYGKLKDGREVAVKRLYEKSCRRVEQFLNEVQILTCLRHQNLVSLYGCTSSKCRELILVYEYVSNGTVADHLYGNRANSGSIPWCVRMRIAIETASALQYLHASDIIHRDVKTNNILLDSSFGVKVADFGLSRLFPNDKTHVSTAPQGTPGYLDPEYHQCYHLTAKSDVYSFGVVLIELVSSLPAVDMDRHDKDINLSNYAMNRIKRSAFGELVDPQLGFGKDFRVTQMTISVAEIAFQCLQHDKDVRPTMEEVLEGLKSIENTDYEVLESIEKVRNGEEVHSESPKSSYTENDGVRLLNAHGRHHLSPTSVTDQWKSVSSVSSTSKGVLSYKTI